jgi:hypothetical protein
MVINVTFNNISWRSVLLEEETGVGFEIFNYLFIYIPEVFHGCDLSLKMGVNTCVQ